MTTPSQQAVEADRAAHESNPREAASETPTPSAITDILKDADIVESGSYITLADRLRKNAHALRAQLAEAKAERDHLTSVLEQRDSGFAGAHGSASSPELSKPPLGCRPRWIAEESRLSEVASAVSRYLDAGKPVPTEWVEEMIDHIGNMGRWSAWKHRAATTPNVPALRPAAGGPSDESAARTAGSQQQAGSAHAVEFQDPPSPGRVRAAGSGRKNAGREHTMTTHCRCGALKVKDWHLVCAECWDRLPAELRDEVWAALKEDGQGTARHRAAVRSCYEFLGRRVVGRATPNREGSAQND